MSHRPSYIKNKGKDWHFPTPEEINAKLKLQEEQFFKDIVLNKSHGCYKGIDVVSFHSSKALTKEKNPLVKKVSPLQCLSPPVENYIASYYTKQSQQLQKFVNRPTFGDSYRNTAVGGKRKKETAGEIEEREFRAKANAKIAALEEKTKKLIEEYKFKHEESEKLNLMLDGVEKRYKEYDKKSKDLKSRNSKKLSAYTTFYRVKGPKQLMDQAKMSEANKMINQKKQSATSYGRFVDNLVQMRNCVKFLQSDPFTNSQDGAWGNSKTPANQTATQFS